MKAVFGNKIHIGSDAVRVGCSASNVQFPTLQESSFVTSQRPIEDENYGKQAKHNAPASALTNRNLLELMTVDS